MKIYKSFLIVSLAFFLLSVKRAGAIGKFVKCEDMFGVKEETKLKPNGKTGGFNKKAESVEHRSIVSEGLVAVEKKGKWGVRNLKGELVINFKYREISPFKRGKAIVLLDNGNYAVINREDKFIIGPFDYIKYLEEGFAVKKDGKWRLMDLEGNYITENKFADISFFREGKIGVKVGDWWGVMNLKGKYIIEPKLNAISYLNGEFIGVKVGDWWGVMNLEGNFVIAPKYNYAFPFNEGFKVLLDGEWLVFDKVGNLVRVVRNGSWISNKTSQFINRISRTLGFNQ